MKKQLLLILFVGLIFNSAIGRQEFDTSVINKNPPIEEIKIAGRSPVDNALIFLDSANNSRKVNEFEQALYYLNLSAEFAEGTGNDSLIAAINYNTGRIYSSLYQLFEAISYLNLALEGYIHIRDTNNIAKTYNRLGITYKDLSMFNKAIEYFNHAHLTYSYLNDSVGIGLVMINIGNVFKNTGRGDLAKSEYLKALEIFKRYDDDGKIANCYNNLGNVYKNEEIFDSAFYYMYLTVSLRKKNEQQKGLSYAYHNLANLHLKLNNTDSALIYISNSFAIKQNLNDPIELAGDYEVFGRIYIKKGLWNLAIDNFERALDLLGNTDDFEMRYDILRWAGYAYFQIGDYKRSSQNMIAFLKHQDSLEQINDAAFIEDEFIKYHMVTDSIKTRQMMLEKELLEAKNRNQLLENEINRKNLMYVFTIIALVFIALATLLVSFRKRLRQTKDHEAVLKEQNEELKRTLISKEEKEILLKEVHHRVKNNLQIINSLIRLQMNFMNARNYKEKLMETENRIRSMALIHEKLYKSNNLAKLSVRKYIEELSINILDSYESNTRIKLNLDIEEREYGIDSLIPVGLIINETLSNSIKHAFFERKDGVVSITLKTENKATILKVNDNGLGADMSFDELKEDSLGMELIDSLTGQLDGLLELDASQGFDYKFSFPVLK